MGLYGTGFTAASRQVALRSAAAGNLESMSSNHTHGICATCGYDELNRLTSVVVT
jgi:hypothetical protein